MSFLPHSVVQEDAEKGAHLHSNPASN